MGTNRTQGHDLALQAIYADRLPKQGEFAQLPVSVFIEKVDVNMAPLPPIALHAMRNGKIEQIKGADQAFSPLALSLHEHVWVHEKDLPQLKRYAESLILSGTSGTPLPVDRRMEVLRQSAMMVVDDLFQNPTPQNIDRSSKVVSSFVHVLMKEPKAYMHLAKLSSHDPYTLQHSVGAAVNSIILGRKIGMKDEKDLHDLGLGGLLHDIGKVKVRKEIINKNGPLDELEWEEMRQHAGEGYELIKANPTLDERTKRAVLEHHEDRNGTGYPSRKKFDEVHQFAKIVSIADVYNALTTNRSYSTAKTPFEAFQLIREKLMHKIDEKLFEALVLVYGGKLPEDQ
jgi:HD-GYP domain-containing protein (c-di-GMP phosphodiesterase class II)